MKILLRGLTLRKGWDKGKAWKNDVWCHNDTHMKFFILCFSKRSCSALLCYPQAAPLPFARSGFSGSLGEDALWPMRHEIAVGERLDKYWFRKCHGCWLRDRPVYPANGRGMERSCPFLSDGGTCIFQHCPRYLWGKGLKAQSSVIFRKALIRYRIQGFAILSSISALLFLLPITL